MRDFGTCTLYNYVFDIHVLYQYSKKEAVSKTLWVTFVRSLSLFLSLPPSLVPIQQKKAFSPLDYANFEDYPVLFNYVISPTIENLKIVDRPIIICATHTILFETLRKVDVLTIHKTAPWQPVTLARDLLSIPQ